MSRSIMPKTACSPASSSALEAESTASSLARRCSAQLCCYMPAALPTPAWSLDTLRLPKTLENAPGGPALHAALRASTRKLWAGGAILVPTVAWSPELAAVLGEAQREGQLVRGLEQIER